MGKRLLVTLSAVALLGLLAGSITFASASSTQDSPVGPWGRPKGWTLQDGPVSLASHEGGDSFVVREQLTNEKFINVDGRGFQPGDYFVFRVNFFSREGRRVGHGNNQCTAHFPLNFERGPATFLCRGAWTFNATGFHGRGQIMV